MKVWETSSSVPIMVIEHPVKSVDLFTQFLKHKVLVEPGSGFRNMQCNCVRFRVPAESDDIVEIIKRIEDEIRM